MASNARAKSTAPTDTNALDTLIGSLQDAKTMPLADAVESLVRNNRFTSERALSVVDDAITDGTLTMNNAFEVGLE